ncbi:calcium-binding protein [Aureimonas flava]|uniref:Calcium-binding protein n=2 Tax=Aureimonas flava TaxID=2320271 RepID=A0A3A1WJK2_9HYPH|nr:calcium-binding protein [Aureimonas flava]
MAIDITGTNGDDVLNDAPANPAASVNVTGLAGFDTIYGSTNADTLFGNAGDDEIYGNGGSDTIYGGQGNDYLEIDGIAGSTTESELAIRAKVVGGQGLDTIVIAPGFVGQVTVYGGSESADAQDQGDNITVNLGTNSYAEIYSNGGNDFVELGGSVREIAGELSSRFYVHAGQGNDQVYGFAGSDSTIYGGVGADIVDVGALNAITVYGGNGNTDAVDGNDQIFVSIGTDDFVADDFVPTALITGNGGNDSITLVSTSEMGVQASIYGGQGTDFISAGNLASNSYVAGGVGSDVISAFVVGENVSIVGGNGTTDPTDGTDVIFVGVGEDASAQVFGNGGDDFLFVYGSGSSTVYGGAGDDTLVVSNQNGDNNFFPESVVLYGGQGSDLFQINGRQDDRDIAPIVRIADFNFDEDKIAGDQVNDLVAISGRANNFQDILNLSAGTLSNDNAAIVTVSSGALAGTYLVYDSSSGEQVVNITGYTGTADADVFTDPVGLPGTAELLV